MELKSHISVRNLNVFYGKEPALSGVSVDIPDRKITVIIGPSGCGKTTLLKSFNRLLDSVENVKVDGMVLVDGENIYGPDVEVTHLRKKMGFLSQMPYPLPMSIYDNVAYGPRLQGERDSKKLDGIVEHYLKASGLWEEVSGKLYSPAAKLSLGQQQRLCLSRGLAVEPESILCDEPTSALDPCSSQHIEKMFLELKDSYTIVIVTHVLRQAKRLADYVIFLYMGRIVEHGPAVDIFENPRETITREYVRGIIN
jgi:phosphate transport system ATP-binding protein